MFKLSSTSDVSWLTDELIKTGHLDAARAFVIGLYAGNIDKEECDRLLALIERQKLDVLYRQIIPGWPFQEVANGA